MSAAGFRVLFGQDNNWHLDSNSAGIPPVESLGIALHLLQESNLQSLKTPEICADMRGCQRELGDSLPSAGLFLLPFPYALFALLLGNRYNMGVKSVFILERS
jgi:hypothetical protein